MLPIPDLLHLKPRLSLDGPRTYAMLEVAFLGGNNPVSLDQVVVDDAAHGWDGSFFAEDLFLESLARDHFKVVSDGRRYKVNHEFLVRVLTDPPTTVAGVRFRQEIVRELDEGGTVHEATHQLFRQLNQLLGQLRVPSHQARHDVNGYRLEVLALAKGAIDWMADAFSGARSGLHRLHEAGLAMQGTEEYRLLAALLEWHEEASTIDLEIAVGAEGRITRLEVKSVDHHRDNPFSQSRWRVWWQQLSLLVTHGQMLDRKEIVTRVIQDVFERLGPALVPLVQLLGHLEFYLVGFELSAQAAKNGLSMSLPEVGDDVALHLDDLFNPLLLDQDQPPVPTQVGLERAESITLLTGPNSGGKTRLLQALGIAQLLGQSGLYVPASRARMPVVSGLFVSLIEREAADQDEGRLGRELRRIRAMFDSISGPSMVIIDELCSGTNPSEGVEVFTLVLRLLDRIRPVAFITTHFLDFARDLEASPPVPNMRFLQVEVGPDQRSTYQFVPGVASTSLAAVMAERLGVTFDELADAVERRRVARERALAAAE
ncbi:MAG: DNA mismatch repair protein [Acidobacteriota bacterium]